MNQRNFFDADHEADLEAKRLARTSDPSPSHVSATEVGPTLTMHRLNYLRALAFLGGSGTSKQVEQLTSETVRKRAKECRDAGWICFAGRVRCPVTKKLATQFKLTTSGRNHVDINKEDWRKS